MSLLELLQTSTKWLLWASLALSLLTLISFLVKWKQSFRLVGVLAFTLLLAGSSWAFGISYTPPVVIEGALHPPIVFDNGDNLVVAQANNDFPEESIEPTLLQLAENLRGGGRNGAPVHIRIRQVLSNGEGISQPKILGEVIRDLKQNTTINVPLKVDEEISLNSDEETSLNSDEETSLNSDEETSLNSDEETSLNSDEETSLNSDEN
ncbi:Ycf51 family protein [Prochlorococcus sp. MIT 1341]|uniref:Ycf51 family protein n=1 Tax=Prochlorococcus sp. MIT 1341 TaxID=3096221 RepID=UPI002A756501|nr:Ycf51 family protein [Prochlorococcus sp. MIT 1341]